MTNHMRQAVEVAKRNIMLKGAPGVFGDLVVNDECYPVIAAHLCSDNVEHLCEALSTDNHDFDENLAPHFIKMLKNYDSLSDDARVIADSIIEYLMSSIHGVIEDAEQELNMDV